MVNPIWKTDSDLALMRSHYLPSKQAHALAATLIRPSMTTANIWPPKEAENSLRNPFIPMFCQVGYDPEIRFIRPSPNNETLGGPQ